MVLLRYFLGRLRAENGALKSQMLLVTSNTSVRVCVPLLTVFR